MKEKILKLTIRTVLVIILVYLLMYTDGGDIQYIYANF